MAKKKSTGAEIVKGTAEFVAATALFAAYSRSIHKKGRTESIITWQHPYELPVIDKTFLRHTSWGSVDTTPFVNAIDCVFSSYNISYRIDKITQGPTLTQVLVTLDDLKYYDKVLRLEKQFRAAMDDNGVRIAQDGAHISVEIPCFVDSLLMGDLLHGDRYAASSGLTVAIGRSIDGEDVFADIDKLKHILVAGASGSGKSVFVQGLIASLLSNHTPDELELYMVDPKMVEFSFYRTLVQCHVVTETADAINLLDRLTNIMDDRYRTLAASGARDIDSYNAKSGVKMKRIVLFIDELADLIKTSRKSVETSIVRIAQKPRACGIHMVIATQYPVADVVTGQIKANMPTKVCFAVTNSTASTVMLGRGGAEKLLGNGDMLYQTEKDVNPIRLQAGLTSEENIRRMVGVLHGNQQETTIPASDSVHNKKKIFWICFFGGFLGLHRFCAGKIFSGAFYMLIGLIILLLLWGHEWTVLFWMILSFFMVAFDLLTILFGGFADRKGILYS